MERFLFFIFWILIGIFFLSFNFSIIFCQNTTFAELNLTEYNPNPFTYEKIYPTLLNRTEYNPNPFVYEKIYKTILNTTQYNPSPFEYEKIYEAILNITQYNPNPFTYEKIYKTLLNHTEYNPQPFTYEKIYPPVLQAGEYLFYIKFLNITPPEGSKFVCASEIPFNVTVLNPKIIHDVFVLVNGKKYYLTKVSENIYSFPTSLGTFYAKGAIYNGTVPIIASGKITVYVCVNTTECTGEPGCWHICKPVNLTIISPKIVNLVINDTPKGDLSKAYVYLSSCGYYSNILIDLQSNCTIYAKAVESTIPVIFAGKKVVVMHMKPNQVGKITYIYKVIQGNKGCLFRAVAYTQNGVQVDEKTIKLLSNETTYYLKGSPRIQISETLLPIIPWILLITLLI